MHIIIIIEILKKRTRNKIRNWEQKDKQRGGKDIVEELTHTGTNIWNVRRVVLPRIEPEERTVEEAAARPSNEETGDQMGKQCAAATQRLSLRSACCCPRRRRFGSRPRTTSGRLPSVWARFECAILVRCDEVCDDLRR